MKIRRRPDRQGIVLVMTVLVVSILMLLAYSFSYSAGMARRAALNSRDALQRSCEAQSAMNYALASLHEDAGQSNTDTLADAWALSAISCSPGGREYRIAIVDENRKLNVNRAVRPPTDPAIDFDLRPALKRMIRATGGDASDYDALADWAGGESPLVMIEGIRAVEDLTPRLFETERNKPALDSLLATHPAQVNVNTASEAVLNALWDDPEVVRQVMSRREGEPFKSQADLRSFLVSIRATEAIIQSAMAFAAASDYFTVRVSSSDAGSTGGLAALVRRSDKSVQMLAVRRF